MALQCTEPSSGLLVSYLTRSPWQESPRCATMFTTYHYQGSNIARASKGTVKLEVTIDLLLRTIKGISYSL